MNSSLEISMENLGKSILEVDQTIDDLIELSKESKSSTSLIEELQAKLFALKLRHMSIMSCFNRTVTHINMKPPETLKDLRASRGLPEIPPYPLECQPELSSKEIPHLPTCSSSDRH